MASTGKHVPAISTVGRVNLTSKEAAQEHQAIKSLEPRNEKQLEITSLMLNDVEQAYSKADCVLRRGGRCSHNAGVVL